MKTSPEGIALITSFEGCMTKAYDDGGGVMTIGFGHVGPEVHKGLVWSKDKCVSQLAIDLESREKVLNTYLETINTTQGQWDAMMALMYNIGNHAFHTSEVLENHRRQRYNQAAQAFLNWTHDNGKVVPGLVRRRKAEKALYESR